MSCGCRTASRSGMTGPESRGPVRRWLSPLVFINRQIYRFFEYTWGMRKTLDSYLDERLGRGRGYLTKAEAMKAAGPLSDRVRRRRGTSDPAASARDSEARLLPHPEAGRPRCRRTRPGALDRSAHAPSRPGLPDLAAPRRGVSRSLASGRAGLPGHRSEAASTHRDRSTANPVRLSSA